MWRWSEDKLRQGCQRYNLQIPVIQPVMLPMGHRLDPHVTCDMLQTGAYAAHSTWSLFRAHAAWGTQANLWAHPSLQTSPMPLIQLVTLGVLYSCFIMVSLTSEFFSDLTVFEPIFSYFNFIADQWEWKIMLCFPTSLIFCSCHYYI